MTFANGESLSSVRRKINLSLAGSYTELLANTDYTYTAGSGYSVSSGDVIEINDGGFWEVAASGASDHHATTAGGVKLYEAGPNFSTRARMVAAIDRGWTPPVGTVASDGTVQYVYDGSTTAISDMSGWAPFATVTPLHFGAVGDGATNDRAAGLAAFNYVMASAGADGSQYPSEGQKSLYFPSGDYYASPELELDITDKTGVEIYGDGRTSQLDGIYVSFGGWRGTVRDLLFKGTGTYGVRRYSDTGGSLARYGTFKNLLCRDKTVGFYYEDGVHDVIENLICEKNTTGFHLVATSGITVSNSICAGNVQDGWFIESGGELKADNCFGINNVTGGDGETYANWRFTGSSAKNVVEHYLEQITAAGNGGSRTYSISGVVDAGGGEITVTTTTDHLLIDGEIQATISGTTSYDDTYTVTEIVSDTQFKVAATYVASETGTLSVPGWDVLIDVPDGGDDIYVTNDLFFEGGNINRLYVKRGYNINFNGTRLKQQIEVGEVEGLFIRNPGRGRVGDLFEDVPVTGANTGWKRIVHKNDASGVGAGDGYISIEAPDSGSSLNADRTAVLRAVEVSETGVVLRSGSETVTMDDTYLRASHTLRSRLDVYAERNLRVDGAVQAYSPSIFYLRSRASGADVAIGATTGGGTLYYPIYVDVSADKTVFSSNSGNVGAWFGSYFGVGTTTPTQILDVNDDSLRIRTAKTPASASATGTQGQIAWDANYIYVCTATNTWVRAALATW